VRRDTSARARRFGDIPGDQRLRRGMSSAGSIRQTLTTIFPNCSMPVHFGRRRVSPVLLDLARRHVSLELDLSFPDRLTDLAEDGYDLAVRTGALADRAGILVRRLARQRMIVCATPSYIEANGQPRTIDEIARHHAIVYRRSGPVPPWLFPREGGPPQR
jgi:DNA-binding transcriptional LysR family regulator